MSPVKLGLAILLVIVVGSIVLKIVGALAAFALGIIIPLAVVSAIILIIYGLVSGKALGGGGRGRLP